MKTSPTPRFSVVIPCYNEEEYLGDTLLSLAEQDFDSSFEVIVVDNNCTDDSQKIAKNYGARVVTEKNRGVCWARQAGTKAAKGEIIISTDADTIFAENWLQKIDDTFNKNDELIALGGPCVYRSGPYWAQIYPKILFGATSNYAKLFGHPFYMTATNIAFKKEFWSGYDIKAPQGGDELGLLRQLKKHGKIGFDYTNPVFTSARRLKRGFIYNLFVTLLYYYIFGYFLDRIFNRTIIGPAPAFRFRIDQEAISKRAQKITSRFFTSKADS